VDKSDTDRIERKREMKKTATFLIGVLLAFIFFSSSAMVGHGKGHSDGGGGGGSGGGGHFSGGHFYYEDMQRVWLLGYWQYY
jgi:hypothetical protein